MRLRLIAITTLLVLPFVLVAQNPGGEDKEETPNIVERIVSESEGNVKIYIPQDLLELILTPPETQKKTDTPLRSGLNKMSGYRIQVFSDGRNQHTLEARAKARGSAILARFPKYRGQIYSFSKAPNWYTRVGNFRTAAEANAALEELKRAFPAFAREMRAVKCQIVIVK